MSYEISRKSITTHLKKYFSPWNIQGQFISEMIYYSKSMIYGTLKSRNIKMILWLLRTSNRYKLHFSCSKKTSYYQFGPKVHNLEIPSNPSSEICIKNFTVSMPIFIHILWRPLQYLNRGFSYSETIFYILSQPLQYLTHCFQKFLHLLRAVLFEPLEINRTFSIFRSTSASIQWTMEYKATWKGCGNGSSSALFGDIYSKILETNASILFIASSKSSFDNQMRAKDVLKEFFCKNMIWNPWDGFKEFINNNPQVNRKVLPIWPKNFPFRWRNGCHDTEP